MPLPLYTGADFARHVADLARPIAAAYGTPLGPMVGVAMWETGWGKSKLGGNYWGMKGAGDKGSIEVNTHEYVGTASSGYSVSLVDAFGVYSSEKAAAQEFCRRTQAGSRWERSRRYAPDAAMWTLYVWGRGYSTGIKWPPKIIGAANSAANKTGYADLLVPWTPEHRAWYEWLADVKEGPPRWERAEELPVPPQPTSLLGPALIIGAILLL